MKIIYAILAGWGLLAGMGLRAESTVSSGTLAPPSTPPPAPASALPVDPLAEALPILQAKYVDFAALQYKQGDRLSDLATRSNGRITLVMPGMEPLAPILTAVLPEGIAYCRLGSFTPKKDWSALAADFKAMAQVQHVFGVVVDLRENASIDYAGAARMLGLLVPNDTSLQRYASAPKPGVARLDGPVVVLIDGRTAGAAEALAGCLKSDGGLVIGGATAGTGFEDDKLANGEILRFATALPVVAGDTMKRPVTPDIAAREDAPNEKAALTMIRDDHVLDVIQESAARKRMSEASLVSGQDPEWDAYLSSLEGAPVLLSLPRVHDPVLVSALDSVRAIRLSERPEVTPETQAAAANEAKPANSLVQ